MAANRESLWNSGHDESVEVNQRALIDKVLARYSGEFTVFRELLQNSDDAASKAVEIHFETQAFLDRKKSENPSSGSNWKPPDLKTEPVHQWTFKNNGILFRDDDWNRLKKIAEGNPDEEKIGAFGVGFYSLFSVTEEPFVTSGDQWMGFYWKDKKDQLFARRGVLPSPAETEDRSWTSFEMPLRESAPMPLAFDLTRFLASSITFMVHLREVSVFFDGHNLARLTKDPGHPQNVPLLRGLKLSSTFNTMHVTAISQTPLYIEAEVVRCVHTSGTSKPPPTLIQQAAKALKPAGVSSGFFSSLFSSFTSPSPAPQRVLTPTPALSPQNDNEPDPLTVNKSSVVLHVYSADVSVKLDKKMIAELQRSTKKNPPGRLRFDLIYTGKSEYDASKQEDEKFDQPTGSVFQGLRADLDGAGFARIFIGHATGQTTGIGGHISTRFIPTVERESIDLVDRNVAIWNKELLYVGGFLARSAYEMEMATVKQLWSAQAESGEVDEQVKSWLTSRCLHAMKFFTFHPSTPSSTVSNLLEASFFSCSPSHTFSIITSNGIKDAVNVRIPDPTFSAFLKNIPVLPIDVVSSAHIMVDALRARGMIKEITFADVLSELRSRPLKETEAVACMKWWISVWDAGESAHTNLPQIRQQLIEAMILTLDSKDEKILPLQQVRTFLNLRSIGSIIPHDGPLPDHTVPISVSRNFTSQDLLSALGWKELTVLDWARFIVNHSCNAENKDTDFDITASPIWAERVLNTLARAWPSLARTMQVEVVALFADKACIPTRAGLKKPDQAYFPTAHIFEDLPVVTMPKGTQVKGNVEKVLEALGVRKHVDLQVIFDRMIKTGDWTIADLVKYLVAVQNTLSQVEIDRLRQTSAFPMELSPDTPELEREKTKRYKASELYEPLDNLRALKLPIIDWGTRVRWRASSEEAKFLYLLGLRRCPPLPAILKLASDPDMSLRTNAMTYFIDNYSRYPEYEPLAYKDLAYVPALAPDGKKVMGRPDQVFIDRSASIFGLLVTDPTLTDAVVGKLKLQKQPPLSEIVSVLERSCPRESGAAQEWFEVLAGRITEFTPTQLKHLSALPIVPVRVQESEDKAPQIQMFAPKDCYFKRDASQTFHSKLFIFVDFGTKANTFLSACGTKHEPSVEEIVQILLREPKKFYHLAGGKDSYLTELRNIAVNRRLLSAGTIMRMKRAPFLLGSRRAKRTKEKSDKADVMGDPNDMDEEEWELQFDLMRADQVVIVDDPNTYQYFGDSIFCAPQEDLLEEFYADLGAPRLSSLIREDYKTNIEMREHRLSKEMRMLVLERLPLFLHEHTHARPKVQYSWLNNEKNFVVKTYGKLVVTKSLHFGTIRLSRSQDASAAAKRNSWGPIELWLAGNAQVDMYEVAISLCRVLFDVPKANDALLFMTILSTDLRALRRRGYNVDRILKKQRADREAAERKREERAREEEKLLSDHLSSAPTHLPPAIAGSTTEHIGGDVPAIPTEVSVAGDLPTQRPTSGLSNQLQSWRRKITGQPAKGELSKPGISGAQAGSSRPSTPDSTPDPSLWPTSPERLQSPSMPGGLPGGPLPGLGGAGDPIARRPRGSPGQITSLNNIESNVQQAIAACREERGGVLHNRQQMQLVRESLDEGYCDVSGRVSDLVYAGSMSDVKVFVAKDVPEGRNILSARHDAIARFIHIIRPLRALYKLPESSVNIFYDTQGDSIAFNRNASIFLNLRYYEAWHDQDIQSGELSKAFISWFFTLAHEIAHNLVQPHNSEHEFYFSSICEAHVKSLARLLLN